MYVHNVLTSFIAFIFYNLLISLEFGMSQIQYNIFSSLIAES